MVDFEKYGKQRVDWLDITGGTSITLLDYFAGKALGGILHDAEIFWEGAAVLAYQYAEAMLAERNKRVTPQGTVKGVTGKTYG
jgi:hypothetical protein